ncbi:MAG TPA: hypothetical protein VD866_14350, partial [Urbifossiella sp.]|nr:hypothetical protein [Urbifossiella sp.]
GLLAPFFDPGAFADAVGRVLDDPPAYRPLGAAAAARVRERYALDVCVPGFQRLFADARARATP